MRVARSGIGCLCVLWLVSPVLPQEKPEVDRGDPAAVVRAYLQACGEGDVETAVALLAADDPLRGQVLLFAKQMREELAQGGMRFDIMLKELSFLPIGLEAGAGQPVVEPMEDGAIVTVPQTLPFDKKFRLRRDDGGLWAIDLVASIKATTGADQSFLAMRAAGPEEATPWECQEHLRILAQALTEYAEEHDGVLPEAATWMDEIDAYVLDRSVLQCPDAPELEFGYAYNAEVAGTELPNDWQARRGLVLVFEWGSGERNAAVSPQSLATFEPRHGDAVHFATADGNCQAASRGETPDDVFGAQWLTEICEQRLRTLCTAALEYAKDNDGMLPGADTWCDDLAAYLIGAAEGAELFVCPAAPELACGYAINVELAGKNARELVGHRRLVLFMESDVGTWNASARVPDLVAEGRHRARWTRAADQGSHFGYLNGSVSLLTPGQRPVSTY